MINFTFSYADLEYFLLILVRITCFVYSAPFFSISGVPRRVKVGFSIFLAYLVYAAVGHNEVVYNTILGYAVVVMKEALTGFLIGWGAQICTTVTSFAGSIADMEIGVSMVSLMDPATRQQATFTGVLYQYFFTLYMTDSFVIAFRIILPVFACIMILNCILGIMAKVSPQMNMFAVGMQLKVLVGIVIIFLTARMLPAAADYVSVEMKRMIVSFVEGMM